MNKIFYICNYDDYSNNRELVTQPSGVSKSEYIIQTLLEADFDVTVISIAPSNSTKFFLKSVLHKLSSRLQIFYIFNIGRTNLFLKFLSIFSIYIQVFIFLLKRKSEDIVLVYHSKRITRFIYFLLKIRNIRIFFEIEEIYSAVYQKSDHSIRNEIKTLSKSKGNIVVNDILQTKLHNNIINIPCYGVYKHCVEAKQIDLHKTINIVYAGVIGEMDSDVYVAVRTAQYLPKNYCIHILGYGFVDNISKLQREIDNLSTEACSVIYHGCMYGKQYTDFLLKCHVGLCTRVLIDKYSDYTFPSKIFVYLANNIIPVCSEISCVKKSKIASNICFVKELTPECVAKRIQTINIDIIDYKDQLSVLHNDFVNDIKKLLK